MAGLLRVLRHNRYWRRLRYGLCHGPRHGLGLRRCHLRWNRLYRCHMYRLHHFGLRSIGLVRRKHRQRNLHRFRRSGFRSNRLCSFACSIMVRAGAPFTR